MIQQSHSTAVLPPANAETNPDEFGTSEGLEPIFLSSQARERLRVLNQALDSNPTSANPVMTPLKNSQLVPSNIKE